MPRSKFEFTTTLNVHVVAVETVRRMKGLIA